MKATTTTMTTTATAVAAAALVVVAAATKYTVAHHNIAWICVHSFASSKHRITLLYIKTSRLVVAQLGKFVYIKATNWLCVTVCASKHEACQFAILYIWIVVSLSSVSNWTSYQLLANSNRANKIIHEEKLRRIEGDKLRQRCFWMNCNNFQRSREIHEHNNLLFDERGRSPSTNCV